MRRSLSVRRSYSQSNVRLNWVWKDIRITSPRNSQKSGKALLSLPFITVAVRVVSDFQPNRLPQETLNIGIPRRASLRSLTLHCNRY